MLCPQFLDYVVVDSLVVQRFLIIILVCKFEYLRATLGLCFEFYIFLHLWKCIIKIYHYNKKLFFNEIILLIDSFKYNTIEYIDSKY
jgi:hypothetical protein